MKKNIIILILTTTGFFSCKQDRKVDIETFNLVKNVQINSTSNADKGIYNRYTYKDSKGENLIIENSYPKGGMKYADSNSDKFVYAVFWTRIINETDNAIELKINFPVDSYEIPSLPGKYYKVLIPSDTMTIEKVPLFNYGLKDLNSFFDKNSHKSSSLKRTVNPKESSTFYVVTLRSVGGTQYGVLRTGLRLKGKKLFYKIRDKEIYCGSLDIKKTP